MGAGLAVALTGLAAAPAAHAAPLAPAATEAMKATTQSTTDYTSFVDPFMSTQGDDGQNIPGAEVPHGLAKPNPMTSPGRSHSGYDYGQSQIKGFTLSNLDGVGGSGAGGDLLVVPTYQTYTGRPATSTYALPFSHSDETAVPGYYQVGLQASQGTIDAELTATVRSGLERFTFPKAGQASLVLDLSNNFTGRISDDLDVAILSDGRAELSGDVVGTFNGNNYKLYFDAVTSIPVAGVKTWGDGTSLTGALHRSGTDTGAVLSFDVTDGEAVQLTTTLSPISVDQARKDQQVELAGKSFDDVRQAAHDAWQQTLAQVAVTSDATSDPDGSREGIFYTSLYRMLATPVNATSTDGTYRGVDGRVHQADGYIHYDGWGTWDDFRKYSVLAYLYPGVYDDAVQSLVDLFDDDANAGNATLSTLTHAVPTVRFERAAIVIADALSKGVHLDGLAQAWPAIVANENTYNATTTSIGYLPGDPGTTVATSYDDYAMSVIAKALGKKTDAAAYHRRAGNYANVIKPGAWTAEDGTPVGVLMPKDASGTWSAADLEQFQAANLYQGTLWQFNWYPADDMAGLIKAMGGTTAAQDALSHYFGEEAPDDGTRMLKSNANEVDLQTPYLFNYVGEPAKTQKWVHDLYTTATWQNYIATGQTDGNNPPSSNGHLTPPIKEKVFKLAPDGFLPTMDDDTGAMSATFVAAAVGLYPVTAGSSQYEVGSPFFPRVDITHPDGSTFSVTADGVSPDDYYIQGAQLDGKPYGNTWVDYSAMVGNGSFATTMGAQTSTWGDDSTPAFSMSTAGTTPPATASVTSQSTTLQAGADGAVDGHLTLALAGATFAGADGDELVGKGLASVAELPDGVNATVTRTSASTLDVHVTGTLPTVAKTRFAVELTDGALDGVTADQVSGTGLTLRDPFSILVTSHWKQVLQDAYDEARLIVQGNYTSGTYAAVASARDSARTILADPDATDDQIIGAGSDLSSALGGLALSQGGYRRLEAEQHDSWSGGSDLHNETSNIGGVRPGSWIGFDGVSFAGDTLPDQIQIRYSGASSDGYANAAVQVHVGSPTGPLLATVATPPNASNFGTYTTVTADIADASALAGSTPTSVYFVFTGSNPTAGDTTLHWVGNFDWMQFVNSGAPAPADNDVTLTPSGRADWGGDGVSVGSNTMKIETDTGTSGSFTAIANTHNGDWVHWSGVDFSVPVTGLSVHYINNSGRVASDASMDVYLDSMTGTPLTHVSLPATGNSWSADGTATVTLPSSVSGTHDVYVVLHGTYASATPYVGNIGDLTFTAPVDNSDGVSVPAVAYSNWSAGTLKTETCACDSTVQDVGGTYDGAWLEYDNLSFSKTVTSVAVRYVNNSSRDGSESRIDLYLDAMSGTPIASVPLPYTGSGWSPDGTIRTTLPATITGTHTVYAVLHTTPVSGLPNYVGNIVSFAFNYGVDKTGLQALYTQYEPLLAQSDRYVAPDVKVFTEAMGEADDVLTDDTAVASDVATAQRTLQLAAGQLAPRAQRTLMAAIGDAQALDLTAYTPATAAAVSSELATAQTVLADTSATDDAESAEADRLETAIAALVAKPLPVPAAPTAVSATVDGRSVTVSWAPPADNGSGPVTGYQVELEGQDPVTVPADTTSYTFTGLQPGHQYRAGVIAVNAAGSSDPSDYTVFVGIPATTPHRPAIPSASAVGAAVTLTWTAPDDGGSALTGYLVRLGDGTPVSVPATATSYTFTGVAPGTYAGTVAAVNAVGTSDYSASSPEVTVVAQPKVTGVTATATSRSEVKVAWTMGAGDPVVLQVALTQGGHQVATRQVWSNAGPVSFGWLTAGTAYQAAVTLLGADPATAVTADVRTAAAPPVVVKTVHSHAVRITGTARVGRTLHVDLARGSWSRGTRFAYVWMANGKRISTGASLKLTAKLAGKRITVRVTGALPGWRSATVTSKAVRVRR